MSGGNEEFNFDFGEGANNGGNGGFNFEFDLDQYTQAAGGAASGADAAGAAGAPAADGSGEGDAFSFNFDFNEMEDFEGDDEGDEGDEGDDYDDQEAAIILQMAEQSPPAVPGKLWLSFLDLEGAGPTRYVLVDPETETSRYHLLGALRDVRQLDDKDLPRLMLRLGRRTIDNNVTKLKDVARGPLTAEERVELGLDDDDDEEEEEDEVDLDEVALDCFESGFAIVVMEAMPDPAEQEEMADLDEEDFDDPEELAAARNFFAAQLQIIQKHIGSFQADKVPAPRSYVTYHEGMTPLHEAIQLRDHDRILKILEDSPKAISETSAQGEGALDFAFKYADAATFQLLLDAGADAAHVSPQTGENMLIFGAQNPAADTILPIAVGAGADVNLVDSQGNTAMVDAIINRNAPYVQALIEASADLTQRFQGDSLVLMASFLGFPEILKCLLEAGAPIAVNDEDHDARAAPSLQAIQTGSMEILDLLLTHKADPNAAAKEGLSLLYLAIQQESPEVMQRLLQAKADPNLATKLGTPLQHCLLARKFELVELLAESRADLNVDLPVGNMPALALAVKSADVEETKLLLKLGADPNLQVDGKPLLEMAETWGFDEVAKLLQEHGAKK